MLDYKETLAYAEFWRNDIAPHLRHLTDGSVSFSEYLQAFYRTQTATKTFGIPLPYVYSLEWLKRYQKNCVTFLYNPPEEVAKGASVLSAIYQMSPSLHCLANIHIWRDEGESDGHVTTFIIYENFQEITNFAEENLDIVKQPKPEKKGFYVGN